MVPRPEHDEVVIALVEFLQRLVRFQSAVIILLIPPPADYQRSDARSFELVSVAACLPIVVVSRMRDERIPRWKLSFVQFGDSAERSFFEIPVVGVLVERYFRILFRRLHHLHVFVTVALTECAVVKEIVTQPCVGHRRLWRRRFQRGMCIDRRHR